MNSLRTRTNTLNELGARKFDEKCVIFSVTWSFLSDRGLSVMETLNNRKRCGDPPSLSRGHGQHTDELETEFILTMSLSLARSLKPIVKTTYFLGTLPDWSQPNARNTAAAVVNGVGIFVNLTLHVVLSAFYIFQINIAVHESSSIHHIGPVFVWAL